MLLSKDVSILVLDIVSSIDKDLIQNALFLDSTDTDTSNNHVSVCHFCLHFVFKENH